ncbi:MAG: hypothetical protein K0S06_629 [Microvirga sp.]|jgi:hypothetical protein|nr:hypothetical protein [Microvirga sp.]
MDSSHAPALPRPCGPGLARRTPLEDEGRGRPGPCFASLADVRTGRVGKGGSPPGASRTRPPARRHDPWPRASASTLLAEACALSACARTRHGCRDGRGPAKAGWRALDAPVTGRRRTSRHRPAKAGSSAASTRDRSLRRSPEPTLLRLLRGCACAPPRPNLEAMPPHFRTPPEAPLADGMKRCIVLVGFFVKRPVRGHPGSRPAAIRDPQRRRMVMDPGSSLRFGRDDRLLRSAERRVTCAQ